MELEEAIEIVTTLASLNIIDEKEAQDDPEVLIPMREKQLEALNVVHDHFVNNVFDGTN